MTKRRNILMIVALAAVLVGFGLAFADTAQAQHYYPSYGHGCHYPSFGWGSYGCYGGGYYPYYRGCYGGYGVYGGFPH